MSSSKQSTFGVYVPGQMSLSLLERRLWNTRFEMLIQHRQPLSSNLCDVAESSPFNSIFIFWISEN